MRVLVIDDSPDDRELMVRCLARHSGESYQAVEAETGDMALRRLHGGDIDCVLLDFSMPGHDGLEVLNDLALRYPDLPIVMVTGEGNERVAVTALKSGAVDYIKKSDISPDSLAQAVDRAWNSKQAEAEILRRANCDELTGLPNRRVFNERLAFLEKRSGRERTPFGVAIMDLDGLKTVNDVHGHEVGDQLLVQASKRLTHCMRRGDLLARIGGDEFVAILEEVPDDYAAMQTAITQRIVASIDAQSFPISGLEIQAGISIGVSIFPFAADNRADLLRLADEAMYEMKRQRKQRAASGGND